MIQNCVNKLTVAHYPEPNIVVVRGKFNMTSFKVTLTKVQIGFVNLLIEISSSEENLTIEKKSLKKGDDLSKILKDERLKGFKIVDVKSENSISEITFGDRGTLRLNESIEFTTEKGQKADAQTRQEAQTTYPIFNFIERTAQATSLKR